MNMAALPLIGILIGLIVLPAAYLVWRFRRGGEAVGGGSLGSQLFGRRKDRGIADRLAPRRLRKFTPVRRDDSRAAIDRIGNQDPETIAVEDD